MTSNYDLRGRCRQNILRPIRKKMTQTTDLPSKTVKWPPLPHKVRAVRKHQFHLFNPLPSFFFPPGKNSTLGRIWSASKQQGYFWSKDHFLPSKPTNPSYSSSANLSGDFGRSIGGTDGKSDRINELGKGHSAQTDLKGSKGRGNPPRAQGIN